MSKRVDCIVAVFLHASRPGHLVLCQCRPLEVTAVVAQQLKALSLSSEHKSASSSNYGYIDICVSYDMPRDNGRRASTEKTCGAAELDHSSECMQIFASFLAFLALSLYAYTLLANILLHRLEPIKRIALVHLPKQSPRSRLPLYADSLLRRDMATSKQTEAGQPQILDVSSSSSFPAFIAHDPRMVLGEGIHYRPQDKTLHCCVIESFQALQADYPADGRVRYRS